MCTALSENSHDLALFPFTGHVQLPSPPPMVFVTNFSREGRGPYYSQSQVPF